MSRLGYPPAVTLAAAHARCGLFTATSTTPVSTNASATDNLRDDDTIEWPARSSSSAGGRPQTPGCSTPACSVHPIFLDFDNRHRRSINRPFHIQISPALHVETTPASFQTTFSVLRCQSRPSSRTGGGRGRAQSLCLVSSSQPPHTLAMSRERRGITDASLTTSHVESTKDWLSTVWTEHCSALTFDLNLGITSDREEPAKHLLSRIRE